VKESIDEYIETGETGGREFGNNWNWIDAAYMAMPLFAQLGVITGEDLYFKHMHALYTDMKDGVGGGLFNEEDGLWWRDADFVPPYQEPNGEDCYWSRGNGWVVGALVRTLQVLPANSEYRDEYQHMLKLMCEALLEVQRKDGMWNVSLHDPDHFGGREVTGSAFFLYGMAWGVNNGLLDAGTYTTAINQGWNTMVKECLHPTGFLGHVQGTGKEPKDGQPVTYDSMPDFEDYGLGSFLLAGCEIIKMR
jgi:unsaturated rhamnogalacturonyl hydrolase